MASSWLLEAPIQLETCAYGMNQKLAIRRKAREAQSHVIVGLRASSDSQLVANQEQGISSCYFEIEYLALAACYDCGYVLVVVALRWGHRRTDVSRASCDTEVVLRQDNNHLVEEVVG